MKLSQRKVFMLVVSWNSNSVQFSHSVMSDSLQPHGLQHTRPSCPSPTPRVCSNLCPSSQWCIQPSQSVIPYSCLQSFPAWGSITMIQFFTTIQFSSVAQLCPTLCDARTAACQASLSITDSRSLPKLMSIESMMPSNHLILCLPLFLLRSIFPASGSFQTGLLFTSGGQIIGVSAWSSVLQMNTQDWPPLGWTGWISLQSKGLSRIFSNTIQKDQFFSIQPSLYSNSHIHTWPLVKP